MGRSGLSTVNERKRLEKAMKHLEKHGIMFDGVKFAEKKRRKVKS